MSMDEGESKAVAQAMIAGGLDPGSASQERNPPPGTSPLDHLLGNAERNAPESGEAGAKA